MIIVSQFLVICQNQELIKDWKTVVAQVSIYSYIHKIINIYIAYYTSKSGIWLVISRVASYFHEPEASANTAYE